jgi:hypothetical protein
VKAAPPSDLQSSFVTGGKWRKEGGTEGVKEGWNDGRKEWSVGVMEGRKERVKEGRSDGVKKGNK